MNQQADSYVETIPKVIGKFRSEVETMSDKTALNYLKAINSFENFCEDHNIDIDLIEEADIRDWVADMAWRGLTFRTALHYFEIISALAGKLCDEEDALSTIDYARLKIEIKSYNFPHKWESQIKEEDFKKFNEMCRTSSELRGELAVYTDMMQVCMLEPQISSKELARMKKKEIDKLSPYSQEICQRHIKENRQYIFPLHQSEHTDLQLDKEIEQRFISIVQLRGLPLTWKIDELISSLREYASLRCGATVSVAAKLKGKASATLLPFTHISEEYIIKPSEKKEEEKNKEAHALIDTIRRLFTEDDTSWFAMHLRRQVEIEDLKKRFEDRKDKIKRPEIFYPCEEIAKKKNKKVIKKERPILPGIVFFKSRMGAVQPMMRQTGDLVWVYKSGGSYAMISNREMESFQRAIAKFSEEYSEGEGMPEFEEGENVAIKGGSFKGTEGEIIEKIKGESGTIYRILLRGDHHDIEWRATDPRLLEKRK